MLSFSIMFSIIFCILQKSHQELSTNWAMRRTISVIDPNASLNISRALTGAPQAVIEITTSYKIKSYRTRSVDDLATKPQNAISETQRCIFNFISIFQNFFIQTILKLICFNIFRETTHFLKSADIVLLSTQKTRLDKFFSHIGCSNLFW